MENLRFLKIPILISGFKQTGSGRKINAQQIIFKIATVNGTHEES